MIWSWASLLFIPSPYLSQFRPNLSDVILQDVPLKISNAMKFNLPLQCLKFLLPDMTQSSIHVRMQNTTFCWNFNTFSLRIFLWFWSRLNLKGSSQTGPFLARCKMNVLLSVKRFYWKILKLPSMRNPFLTPKRTSQLGWLCLINTWMLGEFNGPQVSMRHPVL